MIQSELKCDKMVELNSDEDMDKVKVGHLEPRPFRPFKSSEEYLYAMKEDLAEWLNDLYNLDINVNNFMEKLETGVTLCRHANNVIKKAKYFGNCGLNSKAFSKELIYKSEVLAGTFQARDNISQFIKWCRELEILDCLLFETDDLVLRKNEKSFILCLLEVARRGSRFGMAAPMLVQMEQEIERELAKLDNEDESYKKEEGEEEEKEDSLREEKENLKQNQDNNMKNLHEMVIDILSRCSCPAQFPMIKVADGRYRIGDTKVLIFVRILRNHVMVRVGGGWDTLGHYLDRHDPCRCRSGHRFSTSAKLTLTTGETEPQMVVTYNRPDTSTPSPSKLKLSFSTNQLLKRHSQTSNIDGNYYNYLNGTSSNIKTERIGLKSSPSQLINSICDTRALNSRTTQSRTSQYSDDSIESSSNTSIVMESPSPTREKAPCNKLKTDLNLVSGYTDSSSSEYSEIDVPVTTNALLSGTALVTSRTRKCSPRKIMKTNDLLGIDKPSWSSNKTREVTKPLKDHLLPSSSSSESLNKNNKKENLKPKAQLNSNTFERNTRLRASDTRFLQSHCGTSIKGLSSRSRSSENLDEKLEQTKASKCSSNNNAKRFNMTNSSSLNRKSILERSDTVASAYETPKNCYTSRTLNHSNETNKSKPSELYSIRALSNLSNDTFRNKNHDYNSLNASSRFNRPCQSEVKTWTFKQRSRPPLRKDMFTADFENTFDKFSSSSPSSISSSLRRPDFKIRSKSTDASTSLETYSQYCPKKTSNRLSNSSDTCSNTSKNGDNYFYDDINSPKMFSNHYQSSLERAVPCKVIENDVDSFYGFICDTSSHYECDLNNDHSLVHNPVISKVYNHNNSSSSGGGGSSSNSFNYSIKSKIPMPIRRSSKNI